MNVKENNIRINKAITEINTSAEEVEYCYFKMPCGKSQSLDLLNHPNSTLHMMNNTKSPKEFMCALNQDKISLENRVKILKKASIVFQKNIYHTYTSSDSLYRVAIAANRIDLLLILMKDRFAKHPLMNDAIYHICDNYNTEDHVSEAIEKRMLNDVIIQKIMNDKKLMDHFPTLLSLSNIKNLVKYNDLMEIALNKSYYEILLNLSSNSFLKEEDAIKIYKSYPSDRPIWHKLLSNANVFNFKSLLNMISIDYRSDTETLRVFITWMNKNNANNILNILFDSPLKSHSIIKNHYVDNVNKIRDMDLYIDVSDKNLVKSFEYSSNIRNVFLIIKSRHISSKLLWNIENSIEMKASPQYRELVRLIKENKNYKGTAEILLNELLESKS